ncbi:ribokinase [Auraticoccus sp. F435]|uniref:Ribokinase n=1 Tax=Auraticoccus cholistanensis TaxID=2656650 RepID=A0A6A9UZX1_9ACTN|nr:ribokinase [Auraticoccus cholistanensis]MVA74579.1 ribokinase [Auraticoccus cholistanensis]
MSRVVVLGSVNADLHLQVPRHPRTGETVMSSGLEHRFGGKGANQAVAAARAGAPTVLVGKVGDDAPGTAYRDRLDRFGVDTSRLLTAAGVPTGTAVVYVDADHDNMIVVAPGANACVELPDLRLLDDLGPGDVLLVQLELRTEVVEAAVRLAAGRGARVVLNLAPYAALAPDVLALADPVVVNEHEHRLLQADGLECPSLLVTVGAEGSRWGPHRVPAPVVQPVDTTGAGDAYCGTLAARLALGDDPRAAMTAASRAAADTVRHPGAQPPPPSPSAPV